MEKRVIFIDFDGTIVHQDTDEYKREIGKPIMPMIEKIKRELANGSIVKIFTARASEYTDPLEKLEIEQFCAKYIGQILPITATKEHGITEMWDDRAVKVIKNKGEFNV